MTAASATIVAVVSTEASYTAQPHSMCGVEQCCVVTVDNSDLCVILKGLVSVYFRCRAKTVSFAGTCLYNQPT